MQAFSSPVLAIGEKRYITLRAFRGQGNTPLPVIEEVMAIGAYPGRQVPLGCGERLQNVVLHSVLLFLIGPLLPTIQHRQGRTISQSKFGLGVP